MSSKKHRKKLKKQHGIIAHWKWVEATNPYARMLDDLIPIPKK